jgi:uncharacterized protein
VGATEIDPPSAIRVAETSVGRGVFAVRDIETGETIELCPVLELSSEDASGVLTDYVVDSGDGNDGQVLMLGYGSLYNHSDEPNAEYVHEADDAYAFVALRDIAAGEQVTISYARDWWETRGLEPDSLK